MSSILEALSGGGAPAPAAAPPLEIPDPEAVAPTDPSAGPAPPDEVGTLKDLLGLADSYMAIGTVTEQERLEMQKVTTILQKLLADNERMGDQLTGAGPGLRKALGGLA